MTPAEFKTIRESLGLSAEELAEMMGVTRKTIYGFESPSRLIDVPEDRAEFLDHVAHEFENAVSRAARRKALPRFTDQPRFQAVYFPNHFMPISVQGALLAAAQAKSGAPIDYEE